MLEAAAPHVSAILLERGYLERTGVGSWADGGAGLIVAADDLQQPDGEAGTGLDHRHGGGDDWPRRSVRMR